MSYLSIIPLSDAKVYLKIDDTLTNDDANITRMIKASLSQLERQTNVIFYARSKSYKFTDNCVRVYDFPINNVTSPSDTEVKEKELYNIYTTSTKDNLVLNVGYTNVADVPEDLIEVAYKLIDIMYYNRKEGLSMLDEMIIDSHRRFIL